MNLFYSYLIRNASVSTAQTAETLYPIAGVGPVDDAWDHYSEFKDYAHSLIYEVLDINRFKDENEAFVNALPETLDLQKVTSEVSEAFKNHVAAVDMAELVDKAEAAVLIRMEQHIWTNGFTALADAVAVMQQNLLRTSEQYARMQETPEKTALEASYEDATRISLAEKLVKSNVDDILIYRQDMIEYLEKVCDNIMYAFWERFFGILSTSSVFMDAQARIESFANHIASLGIQPTDNLSYQLPDSLRNINELIFMDMSTDPQSALTCAFGMVSESL